MVEVTAVRETGGTATTEAPILLDVRHLKMHFERRKGWFGRQITTTKAVDNVSFFIRRGETLGLVGESGCGKTTVGRCIMRVYQPTAGEIIYYPGGKHTDAEKSNAVDLTRLDRAALKPYRQEIRMIFQDPYASLNPRMTVFEIISEVLRVNGLLTGSALEDRVAQLLRRVGLRPEYMKRYPHAFSGGERQRIGIARALATNPHLIVADEAISALDVSIRAQILNLLKDLQDEFGLTYLFIAHDLSVIRHICDRVNVMYVGKLVESAESTALYRQPKHPYTEALMSAVPIHNPRMRNKGRRIRLEGDVADPSNPPSGCYFHPRCRYAEERCATHEPALSSLETGEGNAERFVACHFAEDLSLRGVIGTNMVGTNAVGSGQAGQSTTEGTA